MSSSITVALSTATHSPVGLIRLVSARRGHHHHRRMRSGPRSLRSGRVRAPPTSSYWTSPFRTRTVSCLRANCATEPCAGDRRADLERPGRLCSALSERRLRLRRQDRPGQRGARAIRHAAVAASSFTAPAWSLRWLVAPCLEGTARLHSVQGSGRCSRCWPAVTPYRRSPAPCRQPVDAKTYVSRLYDKLGATNRANAIMTALRLGLITSDSRSPA